MAVNQGFEKLRVRENFDTWVISAKSYLVIKGFWSCTKAIPSANSDSAVLEKHEKALSEAL